MKILHRPYGNGAGFGASTGMELALGRPVDIAINHDPTAKTNYKTMIHGLRLRLDREPTDSEIYAYLLEVNK